MTIVILFLGIISSCLAILILTAIKSYHFDQKILNDSFIESQWSTAQGCGQVCRIPQKSIEAIRTCDILICIFTLAILFISVGIRCLI